MKIAKMRFCLNPARNGKITDKIHITNQKINPLICIFASEKSKSKDAERPKALFRLSATSETIPEKPIKPI